METMKRNNLVRIISLLSAAAVVLSAAGCKGGSKSKGDLQQPVFENNTAVIEYTSMGKDGKKVDASTVVDVEDELTDTYYAGLPLSKKLVGKGEKERIEKRISDFQIDENKFKEIQDNAEEWETFSYLTYVANTSAKRIAFAYVSADKDDNLIIDTNLCCEYGMNPGNGMTIEVSGFINKKAYPDKEAAKKALGKLNLKLKYAYVADENETVEDWDKADVRYLPLDIG